MKRNRIVLQCAIITIILITTIWYWGDDEIWNTAFLQGPAEAGAAEAKVNLLKNGGFEQKGDKALPRSWQLIPGKKKRGEALMDSQIFNSGGYSLRLKPTRRNTREGFGVFTRLDPSLIQGKDITISGYARIENIKKNTAAILLKTDRSVWVVIPKVAEDKFVPFSKSIKIADSIPEALLFILVGGKKGGVWIDDLSLEVTYDATAETVIPDTGEEVAKINTAGWQDSAFISPDGRELYFAYVPYAQKDYEDILFGRLSERDVKKRGPIRPGSHGTMFLETYKAVRGEDGTWGQPINLNINGAYSLYSAKLSFDGNELYYTSETLPGNFGGSDIYFSKKMPDGNWGPPVNLGPHINTQYNDDHPCLSADGKYLYFARNKIGTAYGWEIMISKRVDGKWTKAERLASPINQSNPKKSANHQPFITADGKGLYFTRIQQLYKSERRPNGKWGKPVRIFKRLAGHASVTADGRLLYFLSAKDKESLARSNWTIWYSEKKKDGSWGQPKPVD